MANLSQGLIEQFAEKNYMLCFENDALITFEVPIWDSESFIPSWEIFVLSMGITRGELKISYRDKFTSDEYVLPEDIIELVREAAIEKGWYKIDGMGIKN